MQVNIYYILVVGKHMKCFKCMVMFKRFCKAEITIFRQLLKLLWTQDYSLLFLAGSFRSFPSRVCEERN